MILEFRSAQIAIGHAHGEFGALERLYRRCTALNQRAGALEFVLRLVGLRLRALDDGFGALQRSLGGPQPLLRLTPAARIEKRRGRGHDRRDDIVGGDLIADLESYPRQPSGERRCHYISLADARLAVLVDTGDETSLGDGRRLDRYRPRHHGPGNAGRGRQ